MKLKNGGVQLRLDGAMVGFFIICRAMDILKELAG